MEIDIKRGDAHDMLHMNGVYSGLLRCAFEGKLEGIIGGPNCRSRSILRHRPIPGCPNAPRPVRSWNGEGFGKHNLSPEEKAMVLEDDTLMMRMIVLFLISSYVKKAEDLMSDPWFLLEQPADPVAKNAEVSWWRTPQWKTLANKSNFVSESSVTRWQHSVVIFPSVWSSSRCLGSPTLSVFKTPKVCHGGPPEWWMWSQQHRFSTLSSKNLVCLSCLGKIIYRWVMFHIAGTARFVKEPFNFNDLTEGSNL